MGNCFGLAKYGSVDSSEVESKLSETNEAATSKLASLTAQLQTLQDQRRRTEKEIQDRASENPNEATIIQDCIANNKPLPTRCLALHSDLKTLADSYAAVNRSIAATQKYIQRLQAQRETVASLNEQHEQMTMFSNAQKAVEALGFTPDSVIQQQEELNSIVRNMDQLRDTVQFDVHEAHVSTSNGGSLSAIMGILAEVNEDTNDDELYLLQPSASRSDTKKALLNPTAAATTSVFGTSALRAVDTSDDDVVVEMTGTAAAAPTRRPRPPPAASSTAQQRRKPITSVLQNGFSNAKRAEIDALGS